MRKINAQNEASNQRESDFMAGVGVVLGAVVVGAAAHDIHNNNLPTLEQVGDLSLVREVVIAKYHNLRGEGKVLIDMKQNGTEWKRLVFFKAGETRELFMVMPNVAPGTVHVSTQPAELASSQELAGAIDLPE